jgi:hypothetical protein
VRDRIASVVSKETIDNKEAPEDKTQRLFDAGKLGDSAIKILKKKNRVSII